jgi:hypothetical protein
MPDMPRLAAGVSSDVSWVLFRVQSDAGSGAAEALKCRLNTGLFQFAAAPGSMVLNRMDFGFAASGS